MEGETIKETDPPQNQVYSILADQNTDHPLLLLTNKPQGLHPHLPKHVLTGEKAPPTRIEVLVDGTIPPESSLSSSAAMTVCSSIVILESLGARQHISRREMAEVAIESERYVGVASGGMDQSASIFGHPNSVLHITFHPGLAISRVQMPSCTSPEFTFLVANSLVVSDKKVNGPVQYNLRVVELLIAARVFAAKNGLPLDDSTKTWRKLMAVYFEHSPLASKGQDAELDSVRDQLGDEAAQIWLMSKLVSTQLPEGLITREKAEELTGYRGAAFDQEFLSQFEIRAPNGFNLFNRTRHVFAESLRVHQFRALCLSTQGGSASPDLYGKLGELMNDSHASLARDYENTCPELEKIVSLCRQHGSIGSRLTGAGWGGSTVHLVPKDKVLEITEALRRDFYAERWPDVKGDKLQGATLESQPAGGACVLHLES